MRYRTSVFLGLVLGFVTGCTTIDAGTCPPLKQWTPEQQEQLYIELDALPEGAITIDVIADYMTLREQVRACQ